MPPKRRVNGRGNTSSNTSSDKKLLKKLIDTQNRLMRWIEQYRVERLLYPDSYHNRRVTNEQYDDRVAQLSQVRQLIKQLTR